MITLKTIQIGAIVLDIVLIAILILKIRRDIKKYNAKD